MLNITHYQRNANQNHNEVQFQCHSEWLLSKSLQAINAGEDVEKKEPYCTAGNGNIQPLWRTAQRFLNKLGIKLPYDPAIPLLGIYPEETIIEKDTGTTIFIAALFTLART